MASKEIQSPDRPFSSSISSENMEYRRVLVADVQIRKTLLRQCGLSGDRVIFNFLEEKGPQLGIFLLPHSSEADVAHLKKVLAKFSFKFITTTTSTPHPEAYSPMKLIFQRNLPHPK